MNRKLSSVALLAVVSAGLVGGVAWYRANDSEGHLPVAPSGSEPGAAVSGTPPATSTPSPPMVNGIQVREWLLHAPTTLPGGVIAYLEKRCDPGDCYLGGLDRVGAAMAEGKLDYRAERLLSHQAVAPIAAPPVFGNGGDVYVTACVQKPCSQYDEGPGTRTAMRRSADGGVTWTDAALLDGSWYAAGWSKASLLLGTNLFDGNTFVRTKFVNWPANTEIVPPAAVATIGNDGYAGRAMFSSGRLFWQLGDRETYLREDGTVLWKSDLGKAVYHGEGVRLVAVSPDESVIVVGWQQNNSGARPERTGVYLEGKLSAVFSSPESHRLGVGGWLEDGRLMGNVRLSSDTLEAAIKREQPDYPLVREPNGNQMNVPVVIDLRNGELRPIEIYGPFAGDEYLSVNHILKVVEAKAWLRVPLQPDGGCLEVFSGSGGGDLLACYSPGVLLSHGGSAVTIEARGTFEAVITPDGRRGWVDSMALRE